MKKFYSVAIVFLGIINTNNVYGMGLLKLICDCDEKIDYQLLMKASSQGNLKVVREQVELGALVNQADEYGWTPLHHAARDDHDNVVEFLISRGAQVDATTKDKDWTSLHLAAFWGNMNAIRVLLDKGA